MARKGPPIGNTNAAKGKMFYDSLRLVLARGDYKRLRTITEQLVKLAESGEPWAVQMVADRLDGKAAQSVAVTGADDGPLVVEVVKLADAGK